MNLYWTLENVFSAEVESPCDGSVCIGVDAEVPMRGDHRMPRRGNRYYPTTIKVEAASDYWLFPEQARELANQLVAAADRCDAIDNPDTDICGHWWPCDCERSGASHGSEADPPVSPAGERSRA